jgi:hypothetical protein
LVEVDKDISLAFEVKELSEDEDFKTEPMTISSRTVGDHVRRKINDAKKQIQFAAKQGIPSVLLIYNNLDPKHMFGTENLDFISAMYGEYTLLLDKKTGEKLDAFQGRNRSLAESKNTSFSAIGRLSPRQGKMSVTLFDNVFSKIKIPYEKLPPCFEVIRIELDRSARSG